MLSDPTIVCPSEFANANETGLMNTPPCLVPITSRPNLSSCYGSLEKLWLDEMQRKNHATDNCAKKSIIVIIIIIIVIIIIIIIIIIINNDDDDDDDDVEVTRKKNYALTY